MSAAARILPSTVYRGTAFEKRSLAALQQSLSMSLTSVGGRQDGGIDLIGWWWLPAPHQPKTPPQSSLAQIHETTAPDADPVPRRKIRVVAQCKAEKKRLGPHYVRELEGVLHRYVNHRAHLLIKNHDTSNRIPPSEADSKELLDDQHASAMPAVAVLVSESAFTRSTILRALSSPIPFFLLHLPPLRAAENIPEAQSTDAAQDELVGSAILNPALAGKSGLLGGKAQIRWERRVSQKSGELGRFGLWWDGKRLKNWTP